MLKPSVRRFTCSPDGGQTLTDYALFVALGAAALYLATGPLGYAVRDVMSDLGSWLATP